MNGNSYILIHKQVIEIKGWIKNVRHADKHYHMLSKTIIFTKIQKHAIRYQEDSIKNAMRPR